jgi:hypothetical protein
MLLALFACCGALVAADVPAAEGGGYLSRQRARAKADGYHYERGTAQEIYDREHSNVKYVQGDTSYSHTCFAAINLHCPFGIDNTAAECIACANLKWEKDMATNKHCKGLKKYIKHICSSDMRTKMEKDYEDQHADAKAGISKKLKRTMGCNHDCCAK